MQPLPGFMCGMRADSIGNTILLEGGAFTDSNGINLFTSPKNILIDTTVVGPNGRDRAAPYVDGNAIFTFLLQNNATLAIAGLSSIGYDYGDVIVPAGHTLLRKHPFMINYRSAWGGIPSFHFAGIQNPRIKFSLFGTVSKFQIPLPASPANVAVPVNLSPYMPAAGGARMALLRYFVSPSGGVEGTAYLGVSDDPMIELGVANPALGGATPGYVEMRVESDGTIYYKRNTTGISVFLYLEGYDVTEVTN